MKQIFTSIFLACGLLAAASPLDSIVSSVIENNPTIKADYDRAVAAVATLQAENMPEGLEVEFERLWSANANPNRWSLGVSQAFELPGVYRARNNAIEAANALADALAASNVCDKALQAKLLVLDIVNARQRYKLYEEINANIIGIYEAVRTAYEHGEATILDLRKMEFAAFESQRKLSEISQDINTLQARLEALGADLPTDLSAFDTYPVQALTEPTDLPSMYPDVQLAQARADLAAASASVVRRSALPKFALGYVHAFEDNTHFNGLSFSITLPSFSASKRRKAAALEAEALTYDTQSVALANATADAALYANTCRLKCLEEDYKNLSGDNSYLNLLQQSYDGGQLTIIQYLTEVNYFADLRLTYLDILYRYNLNIANLNRYRSPLFR